MEIKGFGCKNGSSQNALVTLFRNATALEADPLQLIATVFTGKITVRPANVIQYTEKRKHIYTVTYFSSTSGRIYLYDDSFQDEIPC